MILPIGHQHWTTRRLPWITVLIALSCLGMWLWTLQVRSELVQYSSAHYQEAAQAYWEDHPYLEPRGELAFHMMLAERAEGLADDVEREARDRGADYIEEQDVLAAAKDVHEEWELWVVSKRMAFQAQAPSDGAVFLAEQEELDRLSAFGFVIPEEQIPVEGERLTKRFGLVPNQPFSETLFTHIFMHASWAHLFGNMFLLFLVGPALEDRWGRPLFAAFYVAAGLAAGAFYATLSMDSGLPLVGASGAVSGALGAFLVLFWSTRIKFLYFFVFIPPIWGTFSLPSWVVLPLWFANEVGSAWAAEHFGLQTNVAYWAHVGGFLSGALFAMSIRGLRLEDRFLQGSIDRRLERKRAKQTLPHGRKLIEAGNYSEAYFLFEHQLENSSQPTPEFLLGYWESAVAFFKRDEAAPVISAAIRAKQETGDPLGAARMWQRVVAVDPRLPLDPKSHIAAAEAALAKKDTELATLALRYALSRIFEETSPALQLRVASMAAKADPPTEALALQQAVANAQLPDAKRERIQARVDQLTKSGVSAAADPLAEWLATIEAERSRSEIQEVEAETGIAIDLGLDGAATARFATLKLREIAPIALDERGLHVAISDNKTAVVKTDRWQAVAVGIVPGEAGKPVLLIDLLLNWQDVEGEQLQSLRFRSDRIDPCRIMASTGRPTEALVELLESLCRRAGASALPSEEALAGSFPRFSNVEDYAREVLDVAT